MNIVGYGGGINSTAMLIGLYHRKIPVDLILFSNTGGEQKRRDHAQPIDEAKPKYKKEYPLMDWGWTREDCVTAIQQEGLPLPGKSSCFFCPSMKKREIRTLYHQHRALYERAIAIEDTARPNLITVKGLGRDWAWRDFVEADKNQTAMCWMFPEHDLPCNCHDRDGERSAEE